MTELSHTSGELASVYDSFCKRIVRERFQRWGEVERPGTN
jgi:hypothetical protein